MSIRNFLIVLLGFTLIVIVAVLALQKGKEFSWTPTYLHEDSQPYGSMVFDSVMHASYKPGYEVTAIPADSLSGVPSYQHHTILLTRNNVGLKMDRMMQFVKEGGSLIVCASELSHEIAVGWNLYISTNYYYSNHPVKDRYFYVQYPKDEVYPGRNYMVSTPIGQYCIIPYNYSDYEEVVEEYDPYTDSLKKVKYKNYHLKWTDKVLQGGKVDYPMVKVGRYGKGRVVVCSMPLLFTNYGILEHDNYNLIMRIVSLGGKKPIVRTNKDTTRDTDETGNRTGSSSSRNTSLINHILSDTSLKTAFNLTLLGFIIFCFFSAKRKQRVVPVIKERTNGQLGFIKQIGSLHKRNNATDHIIMLKYRMLADKVLKKTGVDITEPENGEVAVERISAFTGMETQEVRQTLQRLEQYIRRREAEKEEIRTHLLQNERSKYWNEQIIEQQVVAKLSHSPNEVMMELIDRMNKIDHSL